MILASKSPRRKEILEAGKFNIRVKTKEVEEISDKEGIINQIVDIANKKAVAVADENKDEYVLAADTVVIIDDEILGKPKDRSDAYNMLKKLSGRKHEVITAYSFINIKEELELSSYDITEVEFRCLTDEKIRWYIDTKEPMDKAGAYGIQGQGAILVKRIEGDFYNVMGFPISKFVNDLESKNINLEKLLKI